ncbi:MAG: hypothetical protein FWC78_04565 [Defluviitaleaceae bacterium]|nr:hypothetical protein [Defluviitaleaceae bacterium]
MRNLFKRIEAADPAQRRSAGNIFKFLAMLLAFTLIARGTSGATLARVVLASPERSEIIEAIAGTATVYATDTLEITAPQGLVIDEMLVNIGQNIERGDAIARFCLEELKTQRIRDEASLNMMQLDMERLENGDSVDVSQIENAQRSLQRAQEDYNATVRQGNADIAEAQEALDALLAPTYGVEAHMLPLVIRNHQRALEDYYAVVAQRQADIAAAEEALFEINIDDTALQNATRSHQRALEDYNATTAQGQADIAEAQEALNQLLAQRPADIDRTAIDNAKRGLQRARDDYNTRRQQGEEAIQNAQNALLAAFNAYYNAMFWSTEPNYGAVAAAWAAVEQAQAAVTNAENTAEANNLAARRQVEDAETSLAQVQRNFSDAAQDDIDRAEDALEAAITRAANSLLTAERSLEDAENNLEQTRRNFDDNILAAIEQAEAALDTAETRAADSLQVAMRLLQDSASNVSSEVERAQTALQTATNGAAASRQAAARQVEDAITSLNSARQNHETSAQQAADSTAQNIISATTLQLDIAEQQATLDALNMLISNEGILYAQHTGIVSFAMEAGEITGNNAIVTLRDTENGGFEAHMQISRTEAERLTVGSEGVVTTGGGNMFFTPTVTGIVTSISQPDDYGRVDITIALPGSDWSQGQRVDVQAILRRASYDFTVPISALNSDNAGYFLHVMAQHSTVMGLQNVVMRVNVTIVASDSDMVSVSGAVSRSCQVIVSSNRPVSVGDRIRVA